VARAAEGLPIHMQKTLFFFTSVCNSIVDMGHYAAPTVATGVLVRFFFRVFTRNAPPVLTRSRKTTARQGG
jgi:hypothetical protein